MSFNLNNWYYTMMKLVIYLCIAINSCHCWTKILINSKEHYKLRCNSYISMQSEDVKYPTKIKSVISKLTTNTQKSLQNRKSRIEIELPPGVEFGVETTSTKANKMESNIDRIKRSNREAARLFTEMFSILSSTTIVLFPTESEASTARNLWGSKFKGQVLSIDVPTPKGYGKLRSRRFSAEEQEQALMATDGIYIPNGTEVLIIAGPRLKDVKKISKIHEKFGDDTLIILLNARSTSMQSKTNLENKSSDNNDDNENTSNTINDISNIFENVFNYAPPVIKATTTLSTVDSKRDLLLYHEFKGKWYLAEKPTTTTSNIATNQNLLSSMTAMMTSAVSGSSSEELVTLWTGENKPTESELLHIITTTTSAL